MPRDENSGIKIKCWKEENSFPDVTLMTSRREKLKDARAACPSELPGQVCELKARECRFYRCFAERMPVNFFSNIDFGCYGYIFKYPPNFVTTKIRLFY